jgi:dynein heavy chain
MTTKLRNPHYLPEVSVKVTLLNFMITIGGLEDQLLGIVVLKEKPELQEEKTKLVLQGAENARQLKEIEDQIIEILSSSEGNILEDETAIDVISSSKVLSNDIAAKQEVAEKTEKMIDEARAGYTPIAKHASALFFCISELCNIEPMYQYSLSWFIALFEESLKNAEKSDDLNRRLEALRVHFTYSLYVMICRSLFEKDKLLFAFNLAVSLLDRIEGRINADELRFFLTGGTLAGETPENKLEWLPEMSWNQLVILSGMSENFKGMKEHIQENPEGWRQIYTSGSPDSEPVPEPFGSKIDGFQKLCLMRAIRLDKLAVAVQSWVIKEMGQKYVEPPAFNLETCYNDSTCLTPLIFVLSPGADPMGGLIRFADKINVRYDAISLGQGQGPKAEALIEKAQQEGSWVVLQNCHLAVSWMPRLERLCEQMSAETTHAGFRLWLTSYPSPQFPVAVLQNGIKMTNDPPKGLRANLMQSYLSDPVNDPSFFDGCEQPAEFKKLLFGLCFFHGAVQERIKFGPLGWNVPYQFSLPDFQISVKQLRMFLDEFPDQLPLAALKYLTGECNYGGRVTDAKDRRTMESLVKIYYTEEAVTDENYKFSASGIYYPPTDGDHDSYVEYIRNLPLVEAPEVYGFHANADITKDNKEAEGMLDSIMKTQGSSGGGGGGGGSSGRDAMLMELAEDISTRVPPPFDIEFVRFKYPVDYHESMNTVLTQELVRFNRLLTVIHDTLADLKKAIKGLVVMNADLEAIGNAMYLGQVPAAWMGKSFPSLKPLGSYVNDLVKCCDMMKGWIDEGPPVVYWISGFFFTHAFLTGVKQNYARKHKIAIDTITFNFTCLPEGTYDTKPEDGAYIKGMFIEGARWDYETMKLGESKPKVLFSSAPYMLLEPCIEVKQFDHYLAPLYRTAARRGVLATTGHSTNFVMDLQIPSDKSQDYWIRGGVAFLLSLPT